jgi:hypothetical protein
MVMLPFIAVTYTEVEVRPALIDATVAGALRDICSQRRVPTTNVIIISKDAHFLHGVHIDRNGKSQLSSHGRQQMQPSSTTKSGVINLQFKRRRHCV